MSPDRRNEIEGGLFDILQLFSEFTGLGYKMVEQSYKILCTLHDNVLSTSLEGMIGVYISVKRSHTTGPVTSRHMGIPDNNHDDLLTGFNIQHAFDFTDLDSAFPLPDFCQTSPWTDM